MGVKSMTRYDIYEFRANDYFGLRVKLLSLRYKNELTKDSNQEGELRLFVVSADWREFNN